MKEVKGLGRGGLPGRKDDRTKENRLLGMTSSILMASASDLALKSLPTGSFLP